LAVFYNTLGLATKAVKQLFPDSDIAGKFTSGRMKTTMIVKKALATRFVTRFVDIPICNIGTGVNIFETIDNCFKYLLICFQL